jgi:3'-phosphoadenosine 5'-phosphosulfate sulfotransferase (PAPS reductase)/FAD synthetase
MTNKVRHVLGISGGKDSAALAIYLKSKYPLLNIEYYFCDTGKELEETYDVIKNLEVFLGKKITVLKAAENSHIDPFDHYIKFKGKFLPSTFNRWCTKNLKLEPFEKWVGSDPVVSYVGIRGDENREGYISRKGTIQSIFPFRKNIWSEDVVAKLLKNDNVPFLVEAYKAHLGESNKSRVMEAVVEPLSVKFSQTDKLSALLALSTITFNKVVFAFLKQTNYPLASQEDFALLDNEDVLNKEDIFKLLRDSGVGVPKYYEKKEFEVNGIKGQYARSRSGCYFCFYQQRIEWVWLYEQHPRLYSLAMEYEKDGYSWVEDESLSDLIKPERIIAIKEEYLKRSAKQQTKSPYLIDLLGESEGEGCAACFI